MSAFQDFCMVCDKQCQPNSIYCSHECQMRDSPKLSHVDAHQMPELLASPMLLTQNTSDDEEELEEMLSLGPGRFHMFPTTQPMKMDVGVNYQRWLMEQHLRC